MTPLIIELEWVNRDFDYIWYVVDEAIYDEIMDEGAEFLLIDKLEKGEIQLLAGPFGGPGEWDFDNEVDKARLWCEENGHNGDNVMEMSADFSEFE